MIAERPTVIQGDCLALMKQIPDDFFDLVFCSPPYEDARLYLPLEFKIKGQEWVDWAVERFVECQRICKGVVCWVVEGKTRNFRWSATPALLMADLHRKGVKLRKPPVFHRVGVSGSGGPDWLRNDYEFIVCSSKGKLPWSDNTACGHTPKWAPGGEMSHRLSKGKRPSHKVCGHSKRANGEQARGGYDMPAIANPGNVIQQTYTAREVADLIAAYESGDVAKYNVGGGVMGSRLCHENEAPFPEKLAEFFIRSFCPPGGAVFDPFGGSGTTAAVAYRLGRNCFTCDIRDCNQAGPTLINRRLDEVEVQLAQAAALQTEQMTIADILDKAVEVVDTGEDAR